VQPLTGDGVRGMKHSEQRTQDSIETLALCRADWRGRFAAVFNDLCQFALADHRASAHFRALHFALAKPRMDCPFADSAQTAGDLFDREQVFQVVSYVARSANNLAQPYY
jgi:hypothetical protein